MSEKMDNASIVVLLLMMMFVIAFGSYGIYIMQFHHRDSIVFTNADRFDLPNQKDLNISIPKGYSIRSEYIDADFSSRIYGWYLTKSSCADIVKMPDPDRESEFDQKAMMNFHPNIYNQNGIKVDLVGLGICAESTQDGVIHFYADKRTRENLSVQETGEAIQGALLVKAQIEEYQRKQIEAENNRKESWATNELSH